MKPTRIAFTDERLPVMVWVPGVSGNETYTEPGPTLQAGAHLRMAQMKLVEQCRAAQPMHQRKPA